MTTLASRRVAAAEGCLAIVSALWLAALALPGRPLVLDEHVSFWLCDPTDELSINARSLDYAATPPLSSWSQTASLTLLGKSEVALRIPSLLGYVLAVVLMFAGGRCVLGAPVAGLASLALAWHPDVVNDVRIGRPYGLLLLEMTGLLLISLRLVTLPTGKSRQGPWWGIAWGVMAACALWTHIFSIPVIACLSLSLVVNDWLKRRRIDLPALIGPIIVVMLALPLGPMLLRIWDWRMVLNFQTGESSLLQVIGPFLGVALPAGLVMAWLARWSVTRPPDEDAVPSRRALWLSVMAGVVPLFLLMLVVAELSSLNNPRYRLPLAAGQPILLGLLLTRLNVRWRSFGVAAALVPAWITADHSPLPPRRLETPQAAVWRDMARKLDEVAVADGLPDAPVFVQSGLVEGRLIPLLYDDPHFQAYVTSRLGRFYAESQRPRFGLPFFWETQDQGMIAAYYQLTGGSATGGRDLFIAAAVDTDINRDSVGKFIQLLQAQGYQVELIADYEPWAMLYHAQRPASATP